MIFPVLSDGVSLFCLWMFPHWCCYPKSCEMPLQPHPEARQPSFPPSPQENFLQSSKTLMNTKNAGSYELQGSWVLHYIFLFKIPMQLIQKMPWKHLNIKIKTFKSTKLSPDTMWQEGRTAALKKMTDKRVWKENRSLLRILNPAHPSTVAERQQQHRQTLVKIRTHKYLFSRIMKSKNDLFQSHRSKVESEGGATEHLPQLQGGRKKKAAGGLTVSKPEHK